MRTIAGVVILIALMAWLSNTLPGGADVAVPMVLLGWLLGAILLGVLAALLSGRKGNNNAVVTVFGSLDNRWPK